LTPVPAKPISDASNLPRWRVWWLAIRPKTLTLAAVPVVVGSTLAWHDGATVAPLVFTVALICALLIQAGTNLFNDVADAERGTDGPGRLGPMRVTSAGLIDAGRVKRAAMISFALALLGGLYLTWVGGWPVLAIGVAALVAGWAYSGGPRPLSHTAWGEVFVILFFGVVAVSGSDYLQRGSFSTLPPVIGFALGLQAAAVLLLNNLRDHASDRRAGRRTLVQVSGLRVAYWLYGFLMLAPFLVLASVLSSDVLLPLWLTLPLCAWLVWRCSRLRPSPAMNPQLALTAFAQVLVGGLLSVGLLAQTLNGGA
jgi:1,4-dihydroxy-2-naphthoate octaprenyltransferase